ncbi:MULTISPECIES: YhcN/YlaJ family sporulation lipoprotein [Paenibacillus]|uniref:YhcN/YlaJ family sporulation lipoprotein n=1 Tax=Paenibacillus TaxID=44249 RepID=UPI002FE30A49
MRGAKIVSLSLSAAMIAGMVGITGCGNRTDNNNVRTQGLRQQNARNFDVNSLPEGNRNFSRSAGNGQSERIKSLRYSPALSNKVAQLRDVQTAHVVVTDRDAYVALTMHGASNAGGLGGNMTGMSTGMSTGIGGNRGTANMGGPYGADYGTRGAGDNGLALGLTGRSGTAGSLFDMTRGNGLMDGTTGTGMRGTNGNMGLNDMNGAGTPGTAGTGGYGSMGMGGYGSGAGRMSGFGTGTGTGTFNGLGNGTEAGQVTDNVPQRLKDKISETVKRTAPHIRNVYVSGNSDFVTQVGNYATQSRDGGTGDTLRGYIADFENMINRIFPGRAGTMTGPNGYAPTTPNGFTGGANRGGMNTGGFSGGVTR